MKRLIQILLFSNRRGWDIKVGGHIHKVGKTYKETKQIAHMADVDGVVVYNP